MGSLVAQVGGAEEGVHQGVDQNIAVAMAGQPAVVGDRRAAQHQGAPGGQGVGVDADADAVVRGRLGQGGLALIRSRGGGQPSANALLSTIAHWPQKQSCAPAVGGCMSARPRRGQCAD